MSTISKEICISFRKIRLLKRTLKEFSILLWRRKWTWKGNGLRIEEIRLKKKSKSILLGPKWLCLPLRPRSERKQQRRRQQELVQELWSIKIKERGTEFLPKFLEIEERITLLNFNKIISSWKKTLMQLGWKMKGWKKNCKASRKLLITLKTVKNPNLKQKKHLKVMENSWNCWSSLECCSWLQWWKISLEDPAISLSFKELQTSTLQWAKVTLISKEKRS